MPQAPVTRRNFSRNALGGGALMLGACPVPSAPLAALPWPPPPASQRQVGVAYSLWHYPSAFGHFWDNTWGIPELGRYVSTDRAIIRQHAAWLTDAGVDFILVDCSNALGADLRDDTGYPYQKFEEKALMAVFEEFSMLPNPPLISIMIGNPLAPQALFNGALTLKCDEIQSVFVANPRFNRLLLYYQQKPLVVIYGPTPALYTESLPPWTDSRFTIRFMTCFVTQQPKILGPYGNSIRGYWSWEDRGVPSFPVVDGRPEVMTVVASWRSSKPEHIAACPRRHGITFTESWQAARRIGPKFVLAGTFNEWKKGEQPSAEVSKDMEPSQAFGTFYLDLLAKEAELFKKGL